MMKKTNLLLMLFAMLIIASCSNDDDDEIIQQIPEEISVVLNEIEYLGDRVEILNTGNSTADINDFFLCLGPQTYRRIGDLTNETASIPAGGFLVVTYDPLNTAAGQINDQNGTGGLGLYNQGGAFADPSTLVDFVQWGAAGSIRETTAVAAGIWTEGDFVEVSNVTGTSIIFDGNGDNASDFSETLTPSFGEENGDATAPARSIVLNEVEYLGQQVEIYNNGNVTADISDYFLCLGPGTYQNVGTLAGGSAILAPGEFLVVNYNSLNTAAGQINDQNGTGGLGLYTTNAEGFGVAAADNLSDFVQWGAAGSARENVAVAAGIWTEGDFVEVTNFEGTSIAFDGEGDTSADFAETAEPTFGEDNEQAVPPTRSIVLNEVEYLGQQVEIYNNGNVTADISDYFLCLGPGTYQNVGTLAGGSAILAPGEFLVVDYNSLNTSAGQIQNQNGTGGLGLYTTNAEGFGVAAADNLSDFVQWGAAGSARENVAVAAGIWTEGDFVEVTNFEGTSIAFDGEGDTSADFAETAEPTFGEDNGQAVPPTRSIVLNEVEFLGQQVEIYNNGNVTADISGYFLCLGPGTYQNVGTLAGGSAVLAPGEFLVVDYNSLNTSAGQIQNQNGTGGLGLYTTNAEGFGVAAAANLSDFVQWGAAGSARENVAVAAGIWTEGEFVTVIDNPNFSIAFDGLGDNASDWELTSTPTFGGDNQITAPQTSIVVNEVEFRGDRVELYNNGDLPVDLSGYFLCLAPGTYRQIGSLPVDSGNVTLAPGEFLVVRYDQLNTALGQIQNQDGTGGLGLYLNGSGFGNSNNLVDYVQWGNQGSVREGVANTAQEWSTGDFVNVSGSTTNSIAFDGEGAASGDWTEGTSTFGVANN